jgi:twitching motility two-component system response regulator PilG
MNNNLANPFQILEERSQQAWTGCLEISETQDNSVNWQIYLERGKLQYITSNIGQQERLNYLWKQFQGSVSSLKLTDRKLEYKQLYEYCSDRQLSLDEIAELFLQFNQEALTQVLSIEKTSIDFIEDKVIAEAKTSYAWRELYDRETVDRWHLVKKDLPSPLSKLYLSQKNSLQFYKVWKKLGEQPQYADFINSHNIANLVTALIAKRDLYSLAEQINSNLLNLAQNLQPFIQEGIVEVLSSQPTQAVKVSVSEEEKLFVKPTATSFAAPVIKPPITNSAIESNKPLVACIDDSKTVQTQVKMTLESVGYEVVGIQEAADALKRLLDRNPALILMDINMPTINGYDLCAMLRRSQKFKEIPIIMLTGRDGLIDRMRAKMVGSTDYLTKPFDPDKLVETIGKFAQAT